MPTQRLIAALLPLALAGASAGAVSETIAAQAYERIAPALCTVYYTAEITNPSSGATTRRETRALGVIVSPEGLVVCHGHMRTDDREPLNALAAVGRGEEQKEYDAEILQKPEDVNLCFLQIEAEDDAGPFPYVRFSPGRTLDMAEEIVILGVFGDALDLNPAVQFRRIGTILEEPRTTYALDQAIPFGFVTGPVIDGSGRAIGLTGLDLSPEEGGELYVRSGHPLVYQADLFQPYIENPPSASEAAGDLPNAWLGVFTQPLTDDLAAYWDLPKQGGVVVSSIVPGSPAAGADIQRGDVFTEFAGTPLRMKQDRDIQTFTRIVRETGIGAEAEIELLRKGEPKTITVALGERPRTARDAAAYEDEVFGMTIRELTRDIRIQLNLAEEDQGVIVFRVKPGSWAQLAGIRPGVIILRMGPYAVANVEDYEKAVEAIAAEQPSEIPVFCRVGPQTGYFRLSPEWPSGEAEE